MHTQRYKYIGRSYTQVWYNRSDDNDLLRDNDNNISDGRAGTGPRYSLIGQGRINCTRLRKMFKSEWLRSRSSNRYVQPIYQ